jgi:myo-inositol-1-phosphate synthase
MEQTLSKVSQDISDYKAARSAKSNDAQTAQIDDSGDQDGNNLENFIKVISKDIQKVDVATEILGDYMKKAENIEKLKEVLDIIRSIFKDIFD